MPHLLVTIIAQDDDLRAILKVQVDDSAIARAMAEFSAYPVSTSDPLIRRIQVSTPDVVLLDVPSADPSSALHAIELLHAELPNLPVFALGDMSQPQIIVAAMRSGAREFLEKPTRSGQLLEAFARLTSAQRKSKSSGKRGRIYTVLNAKGGCGATTVAVNTALSIQGGDAQTAIVDLAPIGHAALHLNLKPAFTVRDALLNLHRLDGSLLQSYMTRHESGVHLLAGAAAPLDLDSPSSQLAALFDHLVSHYSHVLVDLSNRLDGVTRVLCDLSESVVLVAQTDVTSLWSAAKVQQIMSDGASREKFMLVLNRFRKIPGFRDSEAESLTHSKLLWKLPNHYPAVSSSIDRGFPVSQQNHSEIARSFTGLANALKGSEQPARSGWSLFKLA